MSYLSNKTCLRRHLICHMLIKIFREKNIDIDSLLQKISNLFYKIVIYQDSLIVKYKHTSFKVHDNASYNKYMYVRPPPHTHTHTRTQSSRKHTNLCVKVHLTLFRVLWFVIV